MRLSLLGSLLLLSLCGSAQKYYLFIGTYTQGGLSSGPSKGIYVYQFDEATGDATPVSTIMTDNPSYLALAADGKYLYAVNETDGAKPGSVSAFSFDKTNGQLTFLDKQASGGDDPCYISVDSHRKWAIVANYGGGNFGCLPIHADGSVGAMTQFVQHTGKGATSRQEKPHVHSAIFSPDEKNLVVSDLGLDQLSLYHFDASATTHPLTPFHDSIVAITSGSGPRHTSFYSGKPYVYLISELTGTVDAFRYTNAGLSPIQRLSSHPEGYKGDIGSADIHVGPGGRFLYASNRGDANSIAIYAIDAATGKLSLKGFQSTEGKGPRNFMIDASGKFLLVGNQRSNSIIIFRIDPTTGLLTDTGKKLEVPAPVCLKMGPKVPAK
ncbi:MAG TPA: lactonase family protein [Puia sp.]|jgi:6-phosphogluconolactonase|nr:lactonase family protein [Puia sp.]